MRASGRWAQPGRVRDVGQGTGHGAPAVRESNTVISDLAETYGPLVEPRNQLVHALRPDADLLRQTHRPRRRPGSQPAEDDFNYEVQEEHLPALVDLWYAFYGLKHDAMRVGIALAAPTRLNELDWNRIGHRTNRSDD